LYCIKIIGKLKPSKKSPPPKFAVELANELDAIVTVVLADDE
jgi:hypothetical protein